MEIDQDLPARKIENKKTAPLKTTQTPPLRKFENKKNVYLEVDKDVPVGNPRQVGKITSLNNLGEKKSHKKTILIAVGIIILIIIIALITMFVLPMIDFSGNGNDTNDNNIIDVPTPIYTCTKRLNLNIPGTVAVFANGETKTALISANGERASNIQFYAGLALVESIPNPYKDSNNPETDLISLLKEKGANAVALASASQEMINELGKAGIKCYTVGGTIASHVGADPAPPDTSFCKKLTDQNLIGKIAYAANKDNNTSIISAQGAKSPYLVVYDGNTFTESIPNTAKDSNNSETEIITLLQDNNISTIIMASFGETLETKLETAGINCYEAGGTITSVVIKYVK